MDAARRQAFRRAVQMVFQDPFTSLNPSYTVAQTLAEPLRRHKICPLSKLQAEIAELMVKVDLSPTLLSRGRRSSPADNASASALPARSRCARSSSSPMR